MEPVNLTQIQKSMTNASPIRDSISSPVNTDTRKKVEDQAAETVQSPIQDTASQAAYGEVLDISEDGDTVTARPEAMRALEDGMVMLKEDTAETSTEDETPLGSLNGYSGQQIETLYRQGRISRNDYQSEMDRRDRLKEQLSDDSDNNNADRTERIAENRTFAQNMGKVNAAKTDGEIEDAAMVTAMENGRSDIALDIFTRQTVQ